MGVNLSSTAGQCTCAAADGYQGVVTYNTTTITGGCFTILVSSEVLDRTTVGAPVSIAMHGRLRLCLHCTHVFSLASVVVVIPRVCVECLSVSAQFRAQSTSRASRSEVSHTSLR